MCGRQSHGSEAEPAYRYRENRPTFALEREENRGRSWTSSFPHLQPPIGCHRCPMLPRRLRWNAHPSRYLTCLPLSLLSSSALASSCIAPLGQCSCTPSTPRPPAFPSSCFSSSNPPLVSPPPPSPPLDSTPHRVMSMQYPPLAPTSTADSHNLRYLLSDTPRTCVDPFTTSTHPHLPGTPSSQHSPSACGPLLLHAATSQPHCNLPPGRRCKRGCLPAKE